MSTEMLTVLDLKPQEGFVETPLITSIAERALNYIAAGYPVHLCGPTGCGKTTLALYIANKLGRPAVLINGDESYTTSSLIGSEHGYRKRKVLDRYVERVVKYEESMTNAWVDERITVACKHGFTVVYNEFTRSRPEANTALLSILEEKILDIPSGSYYREIYVKVHPSFAIIFTSNPEEYAGVFRTQDALMDRMITINLDYYDEETETEVVQAKSGISFADAKKIVKLVRTLRNSGDYEYAPTVRSGIMIARSLARTHVSIGDESFRQILFDVLSHRIGKGKTGQLDAAKVIDNLLSHVLDKERGVEFQ
ncbi:gas vesicle protein GvpN [Candidatus Bathyarchaeota archaeon]|nr:gas vesicle protein GvpN [Candidatus Bathyarchaeota archaeon]